MRRRPRPLYAAITAGLALVIAAAFWIVFSPQALGGDFAYVFVRGNSMNPSITDNDVVVIRAADDYEVGDVVAYRNPTLGPVLHRIIETDGEHYTFQGDNRDYPDSYQPREDELIGREWITLRGGAAIIHAIQEPRNAALLLVAAAAIGTSSLSGGGNKGRRRRKRREYSATAAAGRGLSYYGRGGARLLTVAALGAAVAGGALLMHTMSGETRVVTGHVAYSERGAFSYAEPVPGGVYDADQLTAPEPLFRALLNHLTMRYDYALASTDAAEQFADAGGSYSIVAEVRHLNGWKRSIELQPATLFAGTEFHTAAVLDLDTLDRAIAQVEEATGVPSDIYSVRVVAHVSAGGTLAGQPVDRELEQAVTFHFTASQLQFDAGNSDLELQSADTVARPLTETRSLSVPPFGPEIAYSQLPAIAVAGGAVAAVALLVLGVATLSVRRGGERAKIVARYGHLLASATELPEELEGRTLPLRRIEDLARVAEAEGLPIIVIAELTCDRFVVVDRDTAYEVRLPVDGAPPPADPAPASDDDRPRWGRAA